MPVPLPYRLPSTMALAYASLPSTMALAYVQLVALPSTMALAYASLLLPGEALLQACAGDLREVVGLAQGRLEPRDLGAMPIGVNHAVPISIT